MMRKKTKQKKIMEKNNSLSKDKLVVYHEPKNPVSEIYRTIRTNIQFSSADKDLRTLSVTSATEGEGKTTTIANLAITLTQQDHTVVIVDGDLRRPKVHRIFELENTEGLTEVLVNKLPHKPLVKQTFVENLSVLPTGILPPNPSELLGSKGLKALIDKLKDEYDYVLVDVPPVNIVTDGLLVANVVDGVILVCSSGLVQSDEARRAKELLTNAKANLLGVILNNVPMDTNKYYYYQEESY